MGGCVKAREEVVGWAKRDTFCSAQLRPKSCWLLGFRCWFLVLGSWLFTSPSSSSILSLHAHTNTKHPPSLAAMERPQQPQLESRQRHLCNDGDDSPPFHSKTAALSSRVRSNASRERRRMMVLGTPW